MRRPKAMPLFFFIFTCLPLVGAVDVQTESPALRLGTPVERRITREETHGFGVRLERDQFLQLVVDQRGVDVVVRVSSPDGKSLGEFDSPNGTDGPEPVSLIADSSGFYRIDVAPLGQPETAASGRYEIKILDLRPATKQELESGKFQQGLKDKGLALLNEVMESLPQIRLPEIRVRAQLQAAQLLWDFDEGRARKLMGEAIEGVKEYLASADPEDQSYYQSYQTAQRLRNGMLSALAPRDPELALAFLRSTRLLTDPHAGRVGHRPDQELQLELTLASQVATKDPKRALQIAEEGLSRGYSYNLIDTITRLQTSDPEAAAKLAGKVAAKLGSENILKNQEAANVAVNLLRVSGSPAGTPPRGREMSPTTPQPALLSEADYGELFNKTLSLALAYNPPAANYYTPERNSAQNILTSLQSMKTQLQRYAPGRAAALERRTAELNTPPDPRGRLWQKYQEAVNNNTVDAALHAVEQAPPEIRDQLYQQVASKAAGAGDSERAKQILTNHITNPHQRQQALRNLAQQSIYSSVNSGRIEEAIVNINQLRNPSERITMLIQIVNQIGAAQKKETALSLLDQARGMIAGSGRAEDQEQMNALFEIGRAYRRFEPKRGFEIVEPLVEQFNEMSLAAVTLNNFGQQFFKDGELVMENGNSLGSIANQLILSLGDLAVADFERAKAAAERVQRPEVRLIVYLAIAQHAIKQQTNEATRAITFTRG